MTSRSACVRVPARIDRFLDLVGAEEIRFHAIDIAPAIAGADGGDPLLVCGAHRFAADVDVAQEGPIIVELREARLQLFLQGTFRRRILLPAQRQLAAQHGDFGITFQDFEAGVDGMNSIIKGMQLGRLVDNMHGRRDLAAIVEQAGNFEFIEILPVHAELGERALHGLVNGFGPASSSEPARARNGRPCRAIFRRWPR